MGNQIDPVGFPDDTKIISVLVHEGNSRASFSIRGNEGCFIMEKDGNITADELCCDPETVACQSDELCQSKTITNMTIGGLKEYLKDLPSDE